jgi:hypothetical protein
MLVAQREWQIEGERLNKQRVLDGELEQYAFMDPAEPPTDQAAMQYLAYNVLALENEVHELLAESGWKPWSTSNHMNHPAIFDEWIDAWHFMMNILWVIMGRGAVGDGHVLAGIVEDAYNAKRKRNIKRQQEGYDGVSGKCPACHRDLLESKCTVDRCWFTHGAALEM